MLVEFQQAFADLVASPAFCREVRDNPACLSARYHLTEREHAQLLGVVSHRGMECTCMLYRANRLAPLVLNLPQVCKALGGELKRLLDDYWEAHPKTNVHFIAESHRFCEFLQQELRDGRVASEAVEVALSAEMPSLALRLNASYTDVGANR